MKVEIMLQNGESIILDGINFQDIRTSEQFIDFGQKASININSFAAWHFIENK